MKLILCINMQLTVMAMLCVLVQAEDVKLAIYPKRSSFYTGERIRFACDTDGSHWSTSLKRNGDPVEGFMPSFVPAVSGDYQCVAHNNFTNVTKESHVISITVSGDKPKALLTAHGDTVVRGGHGWPNLTCSVSDSHQNWMYLWNLYGPDCGQRFEGRQTINVREIGKYTCMGEEVGNHNFFTDESNAVNIEELLLNKATVKAQNSEFLPGETVIMTCDIDPLEHYERWRYEWKTTSQISPTPEKNYEISNASEAHSGDYWCKGRMNRYSFTEWSPAITVAMIKASLGADGSFIPAGGVVTLSCSVTSSSSGWKYFWYKDTQATPLRTTEVAVLNISERGRYWCRGGRGSPVYYTHFSEPISIQNIGAVLAIIIPVCVAVLLILSLIGLRWSKKTTDRRQESPAETGLEDAHNVPVDHEQQLYSALLHSDVNLYEPLRSSENDGVERSDYNNVTAHISS